jgi:hypothetical protein
MLEMYILYVIHTLVFCQNLSGIGPPLVLDCYLNSSFPLVDVGSDRIGCYLVIREAAHFLFTAGVAPAIVVSGFCTLLSCLPDLVI